MKFDPAKTVPMFFDLATSTGWAVRLLDGTIDFGSFSLADYKSIGAFIARFDFELHRLLSRFEPTLLVFESPFVGPKTSRQMAMKLFGLGAHLYFIGNTNGIAVFEEIRPDMLKFFLGNVPDGREEQKLAVVKMCKLRRWNVANDDEADALAGLDLVCHRINSKSRSAGPLFLNREVTII